MPAQVRVLGNKIRKRVANSAGLDLNRRLLPSILAQGGGDLDLGHRLYMMPQEGYEIQPHTNHTTSILSSTSCLSFSSLPVSSNALVSTALPFSTLVIT